LAGNNPVAFGEDGIPEESAVWVSGSFVAME